MTTSYFFWTIFDQYCIVIFYFPLLAVNALQAALRAKESSHALSTQRLQYLNYFRVVPMTLQQMNFQPRLILIQ